MAEKPAGGIKVTKANFKLKTPGRPTKAKTNSNLNLKMPLLVVLANPE